MNNPVKRVEILPAKVSSLPSRVRSWLSKLWHKRKAIILSIITVLVSGGTFGVTLVLQDWIPSIVGGGVVLLIPVGLGWRLVFVQKERERTLEELLVRAKQARKNQLRDVGKEPSRKSEQKESEQVESEQKMSDPDESYEESHDCVDWQEAYVAATNLFIAEGATIWGRHNFMAVLNGLIVAFIGIVLTNEQLEDELVYGAVAFGVILCLLWLQMMSRRWAYYDLYEETCREIEKQCIPNGPQPFVIVERFRAKVRWKGRNLQGRHTFLGQRTFSYWVIGLFVALYVFLAIWTAS